MMHTVGLHSALAINRQRKRREEMRRARERRFSSQSTESGSGGVGGCGANGLGGSRSSCNSGAIGDSMEHLSSKRQRKRSGRKIGNLRRRGGGDDSTGDARVVSTIGMLHVGIVFLVLGLFLVGSGLLPDDYTTWSNASIDWWNELVFSGITSMVIGIFLIVLNHYLSQKEDDRLSRYVERQLTRSRSGKRLIKDEETGCLSTKHEKRAKAAAAATDASPVVGTNAQIDTAAYTAYKYDDDVDGYSSPNRATFAATIENETDLQMGINMASMPSPILAPTVPPSQLKIDLERIMEEEPSVEERVDGEVETKDETEFDRIESYRMEYLSNSNGNGNSINANNNNRNGNASKIIGRTMNGTSIEPAAAKQLLVTRYCDARSITTGASRTSRDH